MQERSLLKLFLGLNAALAGGFVVYLFLTHARQPTVETMSFAPTTSTQRVATVHPVPVASNSVPATNAALASAPAQVTNAPAAQPVFTSRRFTWREVESDDYRKYLDSLRAVGCPEERVRDIVRADIDEFFAERRVKEAVAHDTQWWKSDRVVIFGNPLEAIGRTLANQRLALVEKLLGVEAVEQEKDRPVFWSSVPLSGAVLGRLSPEKHVAVQEICARSIERSQSLQWAQINNPQPVNEVDLARMREQTRSELRKVLTPEEQEEFLLRYSQVSHNLAYELSGINPTPDEFRRIFRAVDPIDHPMQREFGSAAALSPQQRERYEHQRDDAIRGALSPERYQAFLLTKDPLYRQAQLTAMQWRAPSEAVTPLYALAKANETKRQKILTDAAQQQQQRNTALQALEAEQKKVATDSALDDQQKSAALQSIATRRQKLLAEAAAGEQQKAAALQSLSIQHQQETMRVLGEIRAAQVRASQGAN